MMIPPIVWKCITAGLFIQEEDRTEEVIQSFRQHLQGSPDAVFEDVHYRLGLLASRMEMRKIRKNPSRII